MNKKLFGMALALLLSGIEAWAQDYARYYENLPVAMPQVSTPVIPDRTVKLKDYGAVGDGVTLVTEKLQKAINDVAKQGGGHVVVEAGIWLTGPITLKDGVDLHLERNAILAFSPDKAVAVKKDAATGEIKERAEPGINASKRHDISISGEGTIDGNGEWWRPVKRGKVSDVEWKDYNDMGGTVADNGQLWYPFKLHHFDDIASTAEVQERMRAHLIRLTECERVRISGVTVQNSPRFHIVPQRCKDVVIDGVTVRCPWNAQNGDAVDIGNCKNVLIVNNVIDAGDDGICMKGGAGAAGEKSGPCENILIQDNTVYHAHGGFVIGSEFSGGMKNIVVRRCLFSGTDTGLRFKSAIGRGGKTENIHISDITMSDIRGEAIIFETTYWDNHVGAKKDDSKKKLEYVPDFGDIHISNIVCRGCKTAIAAHGEEGMIHNITVQDAIFFYTKNGTDIDAACGVTMKNVRLETFEK
jgi:polygalacturonase